LRLLLFRSFFGMNVERMLEFSATV